MKKQKFIQITKKNLKEFDSLRKVQEIKSYFSTHSHIASDFDAIAKGENQYEYWIGENSSSQSLFIKKRLQAGEKEPLSQWIEENTPCYWIDWISLKGSVSVDTFLQEEKEEVYFLTDPESKEADKIAELEQIGFKRIGSLIKGQGFFKGTSHYVMKRP